MKKAGVKKPAKKKILVLVVEDDRPMARAIRTKLEHEDFEVEEAYDGKAGLKAALAGHPDLILLDIIMPVMDGLGMLRELRKDSWGAKVPVIVLTNLSHMDAEIQSAREGVSGYLVKTQWTLSEVVEKIRQELDK